LRKQDQRQKLLQCFLILPQHWVVAHSVSAWRRSQWCGPSLYGPFWELYCSSLWLL